MRIVIAGGTGFLGRALTDVLGRDRHDLTILTRHAAPAADAPAMPGVRTMAWSPDGSVGLWASALDGADAVINLAGESIGEGRWSGARKAAILDSRVRATRSLVSAITRASSPPRTLLSASAVGYYGSRGDDVLTEAASAGADFLAGVCVQWEEEARRAKSPRTRVIAVRTGLVLDRRGGALPRMLTPFRLGAGGRLGSGRQYWPWIHRQDWVALVRFLLLNQSAAGPVNASAPLPVTNAEFTAALGRAMRRPALMPAPGFMLRIVLGEMADALLLSSQRVVPTKAQELGFTFTYPRLDQALENILR